jgi:hypothetical protein
VKSWNIILATIVIFGAGVITGGLLVNHVQHPQPIHRPNPQPPPLASDTLPMPNRAIVLNEQLVKQLTDKLDLNPEQSQQIKKIIEQGQQRNRDLWKLVAPQFQLVMRDTRQQIRQILTPDQRKEFEVLMKQQHHPGGTNAPPEQLSSGTNTPPVEAPTSLPPTQPAGATNQP